MHNNLEKSISTLIETQFPAFYREEGSQFVDFVTEYYKWMETKTKRRTQIICDNQTFCSVSHNSANIVGSNTEFTKWYANGDSIAICRSQANTVYDFEDYEIFTIDEVVNNTLIIITNDKLPKFAYRKTRYGTVAEKPNALYYARRMKEIKDVDNTLDEFLVYFKEKYLKNIRLTTVTDTKTLIKNSLDIYRSKGTERGLDLLFKIVYGVSAKIYYPSTDLFKASDGTWFKPKYLEIVPNENSIQLINKQIYGLNSGATAYVQNVIRRTVNEKIIDVLYISSLSGNFLPNEKVNTITDDIEVEKAPHIVGSLQSVNFIQTALSSNHAVGESIYFEGLNGREASGRVSSITNTVIGLTIDELTDGGYGYTTNSDIMISENILILSNVVIANGFQDQYFQDQEILYQPYANITYENANGTPNTGELLYIYHANNDVKGTGKILSIADTNSSAGILTLSILSGNVEDNAYYTDSNAIGMNLSSSGYEDKTVTANIVGYYPNSYFTVTDIIGSFIEGEEVYQNTRSVGNFGSVFISSGSNGTFYINNLHNAALSGQRIYGRVSNASANLQEVELFVGVKDISNSTLLNVLPNNYVYSSVLNSNGSIKTISSGSGFSFSIANNLLYTETINISNDAISTYSSVDLDAATYGFPAEPTGNLTSHPIQELLQNVSYSIGKIQTLENINYGSDYNLIPIVKIRNDVVADFNIKDTYKLIIDNATASFEEGDILTQEDTGARALVLAGSNTTTVFVQRLFYYEANNFVVTSNATTKVETTGTGASANLISITSNDSNTEFLGYNANLALFINSGNNAVTGVEVDVSGFGFVESETINVYSSNNMLIGQVQASLGGLGEGEGFYLKKGGFLSSTKKLHDGYYWQNYSYEIKSSVYVDKYKDMLKNVIHVAGTIFFSNLVTDFTSNDSILSSETLITTTTG